QAVRLKGDAPRGVVGAACLRATLLIFGSWLWAVASSLRWRRAFGSLIPGRRCRSLGSWFLVAALSFGEVGPGGRCLFAQLRRALWTGRSASSRLGGR